MNESLFLIREEKERVEVFIDLDFNNPD